MRRRGDRDLESLHHVVAQEPEQSLDVLVRADDVAVVAEGWVRPLDVDLLLRSRATGSTDRVRLGTTGRHDVSDAPIEVEDDTGRAVWAYTTENGYLSLRAAALPRASAQVSPSVVHLHGTSLRLAGRVTTTVPGPFRAAVRLVAMPSGRVHDTPLPVLATTIDGFERTARRQVDVTADLRPLLDAVDAADEHVETVQVSVAIVLDDDEGERTRLVRLPRGTRVRSLRELRVPTGDDDVWQLLPYLTFKARRLTFRVERFAQADLDYLRRLLAFAWLFPLVRPFARVWLVGELPYKAQDTGLRLFEWLRREHPDRRAYYVIAKDSPERANLEGLGNVVEHGSRQHMRLTLLAQRFASSHHTEYLLASRSRSTQRWARGARVFMQHGVMGAKNMVANYGRTAPEFSTDRFLVSSVREREMIVNDFRYRPSQVVVTGLSRFDRLLGEPVAEPTGLLVIPTWRDWLTSPEAFAESEYLVRWLGVLRSTDMAALIAAGHPVTFILHPNMRHYADHFDAPGVTVLRQGDVVVQDLLRTHAALLTDYSSVGLDFSFQHRPVFYYQFDRARFIGRRPSHLDLEHDLPGPVLADEAGLMVEVRRSAESAFIMEPVYRDRADRFITHRDTQSCERVYQAIRTTRGPRIAAARVRDGIVGRKTYSTFRKSPVYYPLMKAGYRVARLLPRRDTVVFESWNGRTYGDSPRYMYEELVRRGTGLRTVWITSDTFRPDDPSTIKVRRLTPRYYWELARARYWVNNQNFPHYLEPSPRTTYVQTWHGTPLKRMQFDAVATGGRDEGYLDRSLKMTGYWSKLLSPSPYASEKFRSAFRFDGEMVEVGYPRNDLFSQPRHADLADVVRRRVGVPEGSRVVLYAPTFRDAAGTVGGFGSRIPISWAAVADALGDTGVMLVRLHSIVRSGTAIPEELRSRIIDVSSYPDMQELLLATDVLVTDYSSSFFDFAALRRPMVFFCYDLESYRDEQRGFYLDFEGVAPGPIVRTCDELVEALRTIDETSAAYAERVEAFAQQFGPWDDGAAASRAVDALLSPGSRG